MLKSKNILAVMVAISMSSATAISISAYDYPDESQNGIFGYAAPESATLNITVKKQEQTQWCWVACAQMIGTKVSGSTKTQSNICTKVKGKVENTKANTAELEDALAYTTGKTVVSTDNARTFPNHATAIDGGKPAVFVMDFGHDVVMGGYRERTGTKELQICDPSDASNEYFVFDELVKGVTLHSGTGKVHSTTYIK